MNFDKLKCMVDLHLHLDGALSIANAKELAKIQNIEIPKKEEIAKLLRVSDNCRDLNEFLEKFAFPCSLLQSEIGIKTAVQNLTKELEEQGLMYAEIRFAPQKSTDKGLSIDEATAAAIEGAKASPFPVQLILCAMRGNDNKEENLETVRVAKKYLEKGVCAVDLAGAEGLFPTDDFADIFEYANREGVPLTIHAGEASGAQSVKSAVDFGACRIGHGVRATEDDSVLTSLAEKQIPLELCPSSNLCTCVFRDISEYPIRKMLDMGICVTLNTDDPSIENTSIKDEYKLICDEFKLTEEQILSLLLNSVKASFADEEQKRLMTDMIFTECGIIDRDKLSLYKRQKQTLDTFLSCGAITESQYNKSLGDLRVLMKIPREQF